MTDRPSYEQLSDDMRRTTEYAIAGAKFQDARIARQAARIAELEAALDSGETCDGMWRFWSDKAQQLAEKNNALHKQLATARAEALREAASLAEGRYKYWHDEYGVQCDATACKDISGLMYQTHQPEG